MLQYDSALDEYTEVTFDEFSDTTDEETGSTKSVNPVLIFKKANKKSKSRSSFINYFNIARIIRKSGRLNIFLTKLPHKNLSYIRDLGNTLLTIRWRWILITLVLVNFICFLVFSVLWWIVALHSGDFERNNTNPCVVNAHTFTGYMLLSAETITIIGYGYRYPTESCQGGWLMLMLQAMLGVAIQGALIRYMLLSAETITTIGYGYRYPTESCQGGWLMLMLQAMLGVAIQGALISTVYVKTSKPFLTNSTSLFSKMAVICLRDGKLRFVFRIHDFHSKIWCGTNISLYFMDKEQTFLNGDLDMVQMEIEPHGLLIFPLEIEHVIDENSPLWTFRPLDILQSRYEIIAVAEGSSNITGQVSQNRTSYSNTDIYWGHRFKPCVEYDEIEDAYTVDYKKFKQTLPFDTPLCSAKKLQEIQRRLEKIDEEELERPEEE